MARRLVSFLVLGALLAACGQGVGSAPPASVASTPAASEVAGSPSVAPPSAAASAGACRTVTHALGDSCIPTNPQRVVTLGCQTSLEYALALGLPLVGHDVAPWEPLVPAYIDPALVEGKTSVGSCFAPDLEAVAELEPDLIIYTFDNGNYPQVSAIAPTVVLQVGYASYRKDFLDAAALLDRTAQAEEHLAGLDTRIAELKAKLAPVLGGKTVSLFNTGTDGAGTIYGGATYQGELLRDLGLTRPAEQEAGDFIDVSLEQIGLLDADVAFATFGFSDPSTSEASEATRKQYTEHALWQTLTFVKNDTLYELDRAVQNLHGIYWADGSMQGIEKVVLGD